MFGRKDYPFTVTEQEQYSLNQPRKMYEQNEKAPLEKGGTKEYGVLDNIKKKL